MTRLQNLVALSTACKTAHDDAIRACDQAATLDLHFMGEGIARHIARCVKAEAAKAVEVTS